MLLYLDDSIVYRFAILCMIWYLPVLGRHGGRKDSEEEGKDGEESFKSPVCQGKKQMSYIQNVMQLVQTQVKCDYGLSGMSTGSV